MLIPTQNLLSSWEADRSVRAFLFLLSSFHAWLELFRMTLG
jgi:hypothetical protein